MICDIFKITMNKGGSHMYRNILEFKGTWRSYQDRVLNSFEMHKKDNKIHIVAAPGSGKTTLGIELIKRIGNPVIIFAPTITIREQWSQRIQDAFLCENIHPDDIISQNLKELKLINITTYQSLHSAITKFKGEEIEENEEDIKTEIVDFQNYEFIKEIKKAKIKTMCLDECHHLRSEWWKALETFKKEADLSFTISLTATPPYDDSLSMWTRYIDMCGEIDEEITVPELVKEGSLCPHQDYVYLNYPTKEEEKQIKEFKEKSNLLFEQMMNDSTFEEVIKTHNCLNGNIDYDKLLDNPSYLSSILIYLNSKNIYFPIELKNTLGIHKFEKMSLKWLQILLQGLLYEDTQSYHISEEYYNILLKDLKSKGFIEKKQVILVVNDAIEKMLVKSVGKCESIKEIVFHEYNCMKDKLRLLILTDYKRAEYEKAIGNRSMDVNNLGVLPFFEMLRRENEDRKEKLKFGVLCGTMVIIPSDAKEKLLTIVENPDALSFKSVGNLSENEYLEVIVSGDKHFIVGAVSELFEMGYMEVLIGTKSLLGEGWDSPCVNTLILASFVGSFMLSNQMRGRAIRTYKKDIDKTSHIWHLVCVDPDKVISQNGLEDSLDYQTLSRRCEHFLGLHYKENTIENGIDRLSAIHYPLTKFNIRKTNKEMFKLSQDRSLLKKRWNDSLAVINKIEVVDENEFKEEMITSVVLNDAIRRLIISIILTAVSTVIASSFSEFGFQIVLICWIIAFFGLGLSSFFAKQIFTFKNPLSRLRLFGDGILKALHSTNQLESMNCSVKTETVECFHVIYLKGGSGHDKTLFAKCVFEFFDPLDNQRYILYKPSRKNKSDGYFVVPAVFAKRKEEAQIFADYMKPFIGKYEVVYTRNEEGRRILLEGRIHSIANKQDRLITKKKIKSALE